jgi:hypothetical protein
MMRRLPGLDATQRTQLFLALAQRSLLSEGPREAFPMPEALSGSWSGRAWWVFMVELHDRPLHTVLGLLAVLTYPGVLLFHWVHRWF